MRYLIHTRDTLPFMGQLLYSSDAKTREYAMGGLSRFVDNLPIPTVYNVPNGAALVSQGPTPYRTADTGKYSLSRRNPAILFGGSANEAEYLQFWKSWWAGMKDKVTTTP